MPGENPEDFIHLAISLQDQYEPQDATEIILVRRMAEAEWMRARAVSLQTDCLVNRTEQPEEGRSVPAL